MFQVTLFKAECEASLSTIETIEMIKKYHAGLYCPQNQPQYYLEGELGAFGV